MRKSAALNGSSGPRLRHYIPLLACLAAGCFRYSAVPPTAVSPDEDVRVRVTNDAAVRIGTALGSITEQLEGRLTPLGADSLALSVWVGKDYRGTPFENARQRVSLTVRDLVEVRRRELSVARTGIVAAGFVVLTALLIDRIAFEADPNPGAVGRPGSPPTEERIILPIRLRF
jgi:hypothetical protein